MSKTDIMVNSQFWSQQAMLTFPQCLPNLILDIFNFCSNCSKIKIVQNQNYAKNQNCTNNQNAAAGSLQINATIPPGTVTREKIFFKKFFFLIFQKNFFKNKFKKIFLKKFFFENLKIFFKKIFF